MFAKILLVTAGLGALWIALTEYATLRTIDRQAAVSSIDTIVDFQPWGGLASREMARIMQTRWRIDAVASDAALTRLLERYPNDPYTWLLRSTIARHGHTSMDELGAHLAAAISTQPGSGTVHWQAAMIAVATEERDLAEHHLRQWLHGRSRFTERALFIARRWINDPGELLDRILPEGENHLDRAMRHAAQRADLPLAHAVWERLEQPRAPEDPILGRYLTMVLAKREQDKAIRIWRQLDPLYTPGDVPAGHFAWPLDALPTFNWRTRMPEGAQLTREVEPEAPWRDASETGSGHALHLEFNGDENLHFRHLAVHFPVPEPGRYRLSGWWRGKDLTTRSLPYLQVRTSLGRTRDRIDLPSQNFNWQPFALEIDLPDSEDTVALRFIRTRTDAFDRYLAGSLWLADFALTRLGPSEDGTEVAPLDAEWTTARESAARPPESRTP